MILPPPRDPKQLNHIDTPNFRALKSTQINIEKKYPPQVFCTFAKCPRPYILYNIIRSHA
jgi:hypothetical protein